MDVLAKSIQGGTSKSCPNGDLGWPMEYWPVPFNSGSMFPKVGTPTSLVPQDAILKEVPRSKELGGHSIFYMTSPALRLQWKVPINRVWRSPEEEKTTALAR